MPTFTRIAAAALVAAGVLTGTGVAGASPPSSVSGTFAAPPPVPDRIDERGPNCLVELDDTFVLDGSLSGPLAMDLRIVFHGPCFASSANFHATGTFTGAVEVEGEVRTGTFDFVFTGTIDGGLRARGTLVVQDGEGGLAGLRGRLVLEGVPGVGGTYSGRLAAPH